MARSRRQYFFTEKLHIVHKIIVENLDVAYKYRLQSVQNT